eukprot:gene18041-19848_t
MAGMSCGMVCMKYILFAFNFVFWLAGIGVLGVGIWSRIQAKDYDSLFGHGGVITAANIMIAAGCFVMLIGFVGCCGAWKESKWLLVIYFILLLFIFILEIAAGIYSYVKKDKVIEDVKKNINKAVQTSYGGTTKAEKAFTDAIDAIQKKLKCCGSITADDWKTSAWYNKQTGVKAAVPKTCCKNPDITGCNSNATYAATAYSKGCVDAMKDYLKKHVAILGGIGVGIAFIQLIGMIFAICLCRAVGYEKV